MALSEEEMRRAQESARSMYSALQANAAAISRAHQSMRMNSEQALRAMQTVNRALDGVRAAVTGLGELPDFSVLIYALNAFADALPANWPRDISVAQAMEVARDGIPLVGVPREAVVDLLAAEDYDQRVAVLRASTDRLTEDIDKALSEVDHPELVGPTALAYKAFTAWSQGHGEAAQALAVIVVESAVSRYYPGPRGYAAVRRTVERTLDDDEWVIAELAFVVAMLPIVTLYQEYYPERGDPLPERLSRHATVHHPHAEQFSSDRALIAVLMQASILPAFQLLLRAGDAEMEASSTAAH